MFGTAASPFAAPAAPGAMASSPFQVGAPGLPPAPSPFAAPPARSESVGRPLAWGANVADAGNGQQSAGKWGTQGQSEPTRGQQGERHGSKDWWQSGRDSWQKEKDPWQDGKDPWQAGRESRKDDWKDGGREQWAEYRPGNREHDGSKGSKGNGKGSGKGSGKGKGKGAGKGSGNKSWSSKGSWDSNAAQWEEQGAGGSWWGRDAGSQQSDSGKKRGYDDKSWKREDGAGDQSQSWGGSKGKGSSAWPPGNKRAGGWNKWERKDGQPVDSEAAKVMSPPVLAPPPPPPHGTAAKAKQGSFTNLTWTPPKMPDTPKPAGKTQAVPVQSPPIAAEEEPDQEPLEVDAEAAEDDDEEEAWEDEEWEGEEEGEEEEWNGEEEGEEEQGEELEQKEQHQTPDGKDNEIVDTVSRDEVRQGEHCEAWMPPKKGWAVVGFESSTVRDAILQRARGSQPVVCGVPLRLQVAHEEDGVTEVETDVEAAWDEPWDRVDISSLVKFFDAERRQVAAASLNTRNFQLNVCTDAAASPTGSGDEDEQTAPEQAAAGSGASPLQPSVITIDDDSKQAMMLASSRASARKDSKQAMMLASSTASARKPLAIKKQMPLSEPMSGGTTFAGLSNEDYVRNVAAFLQQPDNVGAPSGAGLASGQGLVGTLEDMCSTKEMKERAEQRQLDVLEMEAGSTLENPRVNPQMAAKKYQRSAADRVYHAEDTRSLPACARSLWHLVSKVLSADLTTNVATAVPVDYWKVYSFLRDRTRSVRVDLHLQQPWCTTTKVYILAHEVCLRFEILSMYLLCNDEDASKKYDEKMAHKSCSQVMEPLLNAYDEVRSLAMQGKSVYESPMEPTIQRYTILLLLVGSGEHQVFERLPKLSSELLNHPAVKWAIAVASAYAIRNYNRFFRLYKEADFLSATILFPLLNLARQRILWLMVRSTPTMRREKLLLEDVTRQLAFADVGSCEEFLEFHGLEVITFGTGKTVVQLPARKAQGFDVMHDGRLAAAFNERLGQSELPVKCAIRRQMDGFLRAKYESLQCSRTDIVLGGIDPLDSTHQVKMPVASTAGSPFAPVAAAASASKSPFASTGVAGTGDPLKLAGAGTSSTTPPLGLFGPSASPEHVRNSAESSIFQATPSALSKGAEDLEGHATKATSPFAPRDPVSIFSQAKKDGVPKELTEPIKSESQTSVTNSAQAQQDSTSGQLPFSFAAPQSSASLFSSRPSTQEAPRAASPARKRPKDSVLQSSSEKRTKRSAGQAEIAETEPEMTPTEQKDGSDKVDGFAGDGRPSMLFGSSTSSMFGSETKTPKTSATTGSGSLFGWASMPQESSKQQLVQEKPFLAALDEKVPSPRPQKRPPPPTVASWDELFPIPSPLKTPLLDDWEASSDLIVYLFRVGHVFLAWRSCCKERSAWSRWAHKRQRLEYQLTKPRRLGLSVRPPEQRAVSSSSPVYVEVVKELPQTPSPEVEAAGQAQAGLRVHRLALMLPPKSSGAAVRGSGWRPAAVTELLLPQAVASRAHAGRPQLGDELLAGSKSCSVRLLQRGEQPAAQVHSRQREGVSVLEVQLAAELSSQNLAMLESELAAAGSVSALLHLVSVPIPIDSDADLGLDEVSDPAASSLGQARVPDWQGEAKLAMLGLKALAPRLSSTRGLGCAAISKMQRLPAVAALFAVAVPCRAVPAEADGMARYIAKSIAARVATDIARELAVCQQDPAEMPEVGAFCVALVRQREDGRSAGVTMLPDGLREALAWALARGAGPYFVPPMQDLQLSARLSGHWASKAASSRDGLVFPYRERRVRCDFEAAVDASAAELTLLLKDLQSEPSEWSGCKDLATTPPSAARRAVEAARQKLWTLAPPFKALLAKHSPDEFWEAVGQFVSSQIGTVLAPTPAWWEADAPSTWQLQARHALAMAAPLLARQWHFNPPAQPPLPFEHPRPSPMEPAAASQVPGVDVSHPPASEPPRQTVQKPAGEASPAPRVEDSPSCSQKPLSFDEMLRRDAAWTERLLRGVALLAVDLPG